MKTLKCFWITVMSFINAICGIIEQGNKLFL